MAIPFSDEKLVDDTKPTNCNVITDFPAYLRHTREALNYLWETVGAACGQVVFSGGSLDVAGVAIIAITTPQNTDVVLTELGGAFNAGKTVTILIDKNVGDDKVTFKHNENGLVNQDQRDVVLGGGDFIVYQFCDYDICEEYTERVEGGIWYEIGRSQARRDVNNNRYWLGVDEFSANVVEEIAP